MINGLTDIGLLREINEDNYFFREDGDKFVIVVSDGMGGHNAGDIASSTVVSSIKEFCESEDIYDDPEKKIRIAVMQANEKVFFRSCADKNTKGMGATVVVAVGTGKTVYIGNVGDSRAYISNKNSITLVTEDHSYVNELLKNGMITEEEARVHPRRNEILKAVGIGMDVFPDIYKITVNEGDSLLLCTDGLNNMVTDNEIHTILNSSEDIEETVKKLIQSAISGGGIDNITAVLRK